MVSDTEKLGIRQINTYSFTDNPSSLGALQMARIELAIFCVLSRRHNH